MRFTDVLISSRIAHMKIVVLNFVTIQLISDQIKMVARLIGPILKDNICEKTLGLHLHALFTFQVRRGGISQMIALEVVQIHIQILFQ